MTRQYLLETVLLEAGWTRDVRVNVGSDGHISRIEVPADGALPPAGAAERVTGFVVPGMANAHSHAFQRGMAGNTEYRLSARDSFWTWRDAMYALANRITAADLQVLATQLFIEMLKAGYTAVAEFHYLHRDINGDLYPAANALWDAVTAAAATAGIGLTLLPALYQSGNFDAAPLKREQARFALDTQRFVRAIEARYDAERAGAASIRRTGAAFHSLRAVPLQSLKEAAGALRGIAADMPLHIHIAEQRKEVEDCKQSSGRRPIELLLDTGLVDRHWCLVHATHATPAELQGIVQSGAAICVSITTEANLGDGFFDAVRYSRLGGRVCIGSDSQATVSPAEELRWMEYQARLRSRRRAVLTGPAQPHVGTRLWSDAARDGASAIGQPAGAIRLGSRADWLVLDGAHPSMAGAVPATALDHLLFAGAAAAIRGVMVGGAWVVKDGHHAAESGIEGRFHQLMAKFALTP
jgi:formimidoylglutamate deiminase